MQLITLRSCGTDEKIGNNKAEDDKNDGNNVGDAPPPDIVEGGERAPNCYGYAIGDGGYDNPGDDSGTKVENNNVYSVAKGVIKDFEAAGRSIRVISGAKDKMNDNEYRIALRVGTKPLETYESGDERYDYHFMVQTSTGQWAEKHGQGFDSVLWDADLTPDEIPWTNGGREYYDSEIIYFAIQKYAP